MKQIRALDFFWDNYCRKRQKCPWQASLERTLLHTNNNLIWLPGSISDIRKKTLVWYAVSNSIWISQWGSKKYDGREKWGWSVPIFLASRENQWHQKASCSISGIIIRFFWHWELVAKAILQGQEALKD